MEKIPEKVRQFVARTVPTMDVLEILLLVRQQPDQQWLASDVSKASLMDITSSEARLEHLRAARLLTSSNVDGQRAYRYSPSTRELDDAVSELAKWYPSHRVSLISLVFSGPSNLVRPYPHAIDRPPNDEE